jgi:glycosyltransferase involved in cell wall biosynthesis
MRILINMIEYYPDSPSGSARLAFDEGIYLAKRGHEVWIITQDTSGNNPEYCFQNGLHVLRYRTPGFNNFDPRRVSIHQQKSKDLLVRYVGTKVDLVHGHSLLQYQGALSIYGDKVRTCYSVHSPVFLEMRAMKRGAPFLQRLKFSITGYLTYVIEHQCLETSSYITAFSHYTKDLLGHLHGKKIKQRIHVIPGWVDLERFKIIPNRDEVKLSLGWPTDVPVLFTLRRLVPRMGLDRLLYALKDVMKAGHEFFLVIAGSGPLRIQLESLAEELGLKNCVHFAGFVQDDILPLMYGAADAFVLPTAELECFGLIALEALACGRPVLATPVGAIPEVLGRFEQRWLAENNSIAAISKLLRDYLSGALPNYDPIKLREIVAMHYSRENVLKELVGAALGTQS